MKNRNTFGTFGFKGEIKGRKKHKNENAIKLKVLHSTQNALICSTEVFLFLHIFSTVLCLKKKAKANFIWGNVEKKKSQILVIRLGFSIKSFFCRHHRRYASCYKMVSMLGMSKKSLSTTK